MIELIFETVEIHYPSLEPKEMEIHALVSSKEDVYLVAARLFNRTASLGEHRQIVTCSVRVSQDSMVDYLQLPAKDFQK